jgi:hypothetical protein
MDEDEKTRWLYKIVQITASSVSEDLLICLQEAESRINRLMGIEERVNSRIDLQILRYMKGNNLKYCEFETEVGDREREMYFVKVEVEIGTNRDAED